jgi:pimeloyl-ACP methyl ester carboxylesterase
MVQKLDLAENTRYRQAGFEGTTPTLRDDFLPDVTWCYAAVWATSPSAVIVLRFMQIEFFDYTGYCAFGREMTYDPLPALRALRVPALFLFGADDRLIPVEKACRQFAKF